MLPELINKKTLNAEIKNGICYVISKDKTSIDIIKLNNIFKTKNNIKNLEGLYIIDNIDDSYIIDDVFNDEEFNLNIKLKKIEIKENVIKEIILKKLEKNIEKEKENIVSQIILSQIKKDLENTKIKETFKYVKKDIKKELSSDLVIKKEKLEKKSLKNKIILIILSLFLLHVILLSKIILLGIVFIALFFAAYYIFSKIKFNEIILEEKTIVFNDRLSEIKVYKKDEKVTVSKDNYLLTKDELYKIKENNNIKLTKLSNKDYLESIKEIILINIENIKEKKLIDYDILLEEKIINNKEEIKKINDLRNIFIFLDK
jgi:hypothetical protein